MLQSTAKKEETSERKEKRNKYSKIAYIVYPDTQKSNGHRGRGRKSGDGFGHLVIETWNF